MQLPKVFPRRVSCTGINGEHSPRLARKIWDRIRKNQTWYVCTIVITSPTTVTLYVYDMYSSIYGGIGDIIFKQDITDLTSDEQAMLDELVLRLYTDSAREEMARREEDKVEAEVLRIRKELFEV